MQTCVIPLKSLKQIETQIYKFLWNKNFKAAKAPDRIKREIMCTPLSLGGFGLVDIKELNRAIKLKAYSRLLETSQPFFMNVRRTINTDNLFDVKMKEGDEVLKEALVHLNKDRQSVLEWDNALQTSCANLIASIRESKISNLLNPAGRRSITFALLGADRNEIKIKNVSLRNLNPLLQHLKYRHLENALKHSLSININREVEELAAMYPKEPGAMVDIRKMSCQSIRKLRTDDRVKIISAFKIGLVLQPAQVLNWMNRVRKLTSVRHRSTILRIAHGDILSNSRLCRFGLKDNPNCENCISELETIEHKVLNCPTTLNAWKELTKIKVKLGLSRDSQVQSLDIETILGVPGTESKLAYAMNSELLVKIVGYGGKKFEPRVAVERALKTIYINEPMSRDMRLKLKTAIDEFG